MKNWLIADPISNEICSQFPDINPVSLQLLWNRNIRTRDEINAFLVPDWDRDTHDPFLFSQMEKAVEVTLEAIDAGEMIAVHGDYDADGVCATSVVVSALKIVAEGLGKKLNYTTYIPHREKEGYGMSVAGMEIIAKRGAKLVVTVDCGISNKEAIDRGNELDITTIVCDHHEMPEELPEAILIHPLVPGETYPFKKLCGTAVAFKYVSGVIMGARDIGADIKEGQEKWLLDLVAIATVTDVMHLSGENRALEKFGLVVLEKTRRPGLKALMKAAGTKSADTYAVGFQIGPRLNAAGRMTHADEAVKLLLATDSLEGHAQAEVLDKLNQDRRALTEKMYQEALEQVDETDKKKVLIVWKEGWPAGLVGLVAGKLVQKYGIPAYAIGINGDKYVGSGRSVEGFHVTEAIRTAAEYLDSYGGHPQACGFSVFGKEKFDQVRQLIEAYAKRELDGVDLVPTIAVDIEINLEDVDENLWVEIQKFSPFGQGNHRPVFVVRKAKLISFSTVGNNGRHLRLSLQSKHGTIRKGIGFNLGELASDFDLNQLVDVSFEFSLNEWKGRREIQMRILDIKIHS